MFVSKMRFILAIIIFTWPSGVFSQTHQPSLNDLIAVVHGKDAIKSAEAVTAIGKQRPASELAIQTLIDSLNDDRRAVYIPSYVFILFPVETVGSQAADALADIGKPAVSQICEFIDKSPKTNGRKRAIVALSKMESDASSSLSTLTRLLADPQVEIRLQAVMAIVSIHKDSHSLSKLLGTVLSDVSPDVRAAAIQAIAALGEAGSPNVPRLIELLDDKDDRSHFYTPDMTGTRPIRYDAAIALAFMGKEAQVALVQLKEVMNRDSDPLVRVAAAFAIAKMSDAPDNAVGTLISAIQQDKNGSDVVDEAVILLGKLGPRAKAAMPELEDALIHPEVMVRIHAIEAIVAISPETANSRLLKMFKDKDALVRACVIENLGSLGNATPEIMKVYIVALQDSDAVFGTNVRHAAAVALGKLQEKAVTAIPHLKRMAEGDESEWVRSAAINALQQISSGQTENE
ncbi:putative lyase [Planctopirus ephydatiae]|uniref:Putative lyase n=1 Tax=Planctopirus ephydatiae TaxID=2528019 RepID=A0A518GN03_9PLAN|nr:HEAT repeat domain-containing protein [Planctopirus ephydatiae]QDV29821.1 putative lyase [Planctopirus ephydatiae]